MQDIDRLKSVRADILTLLEPRRMAREWIPGSHKTSEEVQLEHTLKEVELAIKRLESNNLEIERKFLVDETKIPLLKNGIEMLQGYIQTSDENTVRVRVAGPDSFVTFKGPQSGFTCKEFEFKIPNDTAAEIIDSMCSKVVEKIRYFVNEHGDVWSIDYFQGENEGLILAEIELTSEDQQFILPRWASEEVTGNPKYFNSNLAK